MFDPGKPYRVYCFDGSSMTVSGDLIEAAEDAEAIAKVETRGFGSKCEIWEGHRLVAELEGERRQA
ncbi:hypothetical protein ACUXST_001521 [Sphingomonas sp. F9_3S_D5_B_2]